MAPAWKEEAGWTLPELMLGLVLSLSIAASSLLVMQTTLHSQSSTGSRLAAQTDGSFALLRMTKDIRSATSATVQSAQVLDLQVPQQTSGGTPVSVHVRYACSGLPASCTRSVCGTPITSNSCGSPSAVIPIVSGVVNTDNFVGVSAGADQPPPSSTPACCVAAATASQANVNFISLHLRIARTDGAMEWRSGRPLDFLDGATLANFTH